MALYVISPTTKIKWIVVKTGFQQLLEFLEWLMSVYDFMELLKIPIIVNDPNKEISNEQFHIDNAFQQPPGQIELTYQDNDYLSGTADDSDISEALHCKTTENFEMPEDVIFDLGSGAKTRSTEAKENSHSWQESAQDEDAGWPESLMDTSWDDKSWNGLEWQHHGC